MLKELFMKRKPKKLIRKLRIRAYRARRRFTARVYRYSLMLTGVFVTANVYAASTDDFSLNTIDDSVKGHMLGDVGRLIGYLLIIVIISLVVAKKYMLALGCLLALVVLYNMPDIIDSAFKS